MAFFERGDANHSAVINAPAPIDYNIRDNGRVPFSIDGIPSIHFANFDKRYWRKDNWQQPTNTHNGQQYVTALGTPTPLLNEEIPYRRPKNTMIPFHYNEVSPYCCPSTLSTSRGCVCTSNKQRDFVGMYRGNNKNYYDDEF